MKNSRPFFLIKFAFNHTTCHLHANAQHRFGDFNVLTLQKRFAHLFGKTPALDTIASIQATADRNIRKFGLLEET